MGLLDFLKGAGEKFQNGDLDVGLGLLAASGPSLQPKGFGQILGEAAQFVDTRDQARMRNELVRTSMEDRKRKKEALSRISSVIAPLGQGAGAGMFTPEGQQNEVISLLGDINPEGLAKGLLDQTFNSERAAPSKIREIQALSEMGIDLSPDEIKAAVLGDGKGGLDDILKRLQINGLLDDKENKKTTLAGNKARVRDTFINTLSRAKKILSANDSLEGTALETGTTFADLRKGALSGFAELKGLFGKDNVAERKAISSFNTFEKNAAGFAIDLMDSLGNITNSKFTTLRASIANIGVDPQTNRRIISEVITRAIQEAQRAGVEIPESSLKEAEKILQGIGESENLFQATGSGQAKQDLGRGITLEFLN